MKHIYLPRIKNLNEIFTGFTYAPNDAGAPYYISSHLSTTIGKYSYDAKRDVLSVSKSAFYSLRATGVHQYIKDAIEPQMIAHIGSFEIVKRQYEGGGWLVIARDNTNIGSRWVCELPADYDFLQHLSPTERELLEENERSITEALAQAPADSSYKTNPYYDKYNKTA